MNQETSMKTLPIGICDFQTVIAEDYSHIDKDLLIDDLWKQPATVFVKLAKL